MLRSQLLLECKHLHKNAQNSRADAQPNSTLRLGDRGGANESARHFLYCGRFLCQRWYVLEVGRRDRNRTTRHLASRQFGHCSQPSPRRRGSGELPAPVMKDRVGGACDMEWFDFSVHPPSGIRCVAHSGCALAARALRVFLRQDDVLVVPDRPGPISDAVAVHEDSAGDGPRSSSTSAAQSPYSPRTVPAQSPHSPQLFFTQSPVFPDL